MSTQCGGGYADAELSQEMFERGVVGTTIQGFVFRHSYRDGDVERETGGPCRCSLGHTSTSPVGGEELDLPNLALIFGFDVRFANDRSQSFDDYRERMSRVALKHGLDDSCVWMEVEPA